MKEGEGLDIEELIRNVFKEILPLISKRIVLFLSGGSVNTEFLLKTLQSFTTSNYDIVLSEQARTVLDEHLIRSLPGKVVTTLAELDEVLNKGALFLIPVLSRNTLAKISLGIADNLITTGIARVMMMNKELIAVRDSYDPHNPLNVAQGLSRNQAYNSLLMNYEKTLESMGVKFVDIAEFKETVHQKLTVPKSPGNPEAAPIQPGEGCCEFKSAVLTLSDINMIRENNVIKIKPATIMTPLARDYIQNNNIAVQFQS